MKTIRALLLAICVVLLPTATPVQAASCKGASHEMSLSGGSASPAVTVTTTPVRFSAVYADNAGCDPISITVTVSGVGTFPLTASGTTSAGGTEYSRSMTLPAGRRTYFFAATSGEGSGEITVQLTSVSPRELVITAPPPPPPPTPKPTPVPTPPPATPPPATPAPTPPPATPSPATPAPTVAATPAPEPAGAAASPEPSGSPPPTNSPSEQPTASGTPSPEETPAAATPSGEAVAGPVGPGTEPGQGGPWGAIVLGLATIGVFLLFALRRRRDDDSGASATVTASTSADEVPAVTPLPPIRELVPPVDPYLLDEGAERPAPRPDEVGVPRWLRPSVREARFRDDRNHSPRLDRLS